MILLLGVTGYIGSAFANRLTQLGLCYAGLPRDKYTDASWLDQFVASRPREIGRSISLVINCAAFIPKESVALCDIHQGETMFSNAMLPAMISQVCQRHGVPFAHISTGCLWNDGLEHSEDDPPQRAFNGHCGFYVGTKVLAEEAVRANCEKHYIWRVRLPFDKVDHPRNYLSKLARFETIYDHENTICHRGDFVKACLDLWQMQADWGTYHCCNPGSVHASSIARALWANGIRKDPYIVIRDGPQGGCKLSVKKLTDAGVKIRHGDEALEDSIKNWKKR